MSEINASRGAPRIPFPMRSIKRATKIKLKVGAKGNNGLLSAERPYPATVRSLRFPSLSLSRPEKNLVNWAVDSANPSSKPSNPTLAPSKLVITKGIREWMSSEEASINNEVMPSARIARGREPSLFMLIVYLVSS